MKKTNQFAIRIGKLCAVLGGGLLLGGTTSLTPPSAWADESVSVEIHADSDFYQPLSPYGRWEVVGSAGRCWIPGGVESDWSPYSNGYWQNTPDGWYWASNEPWGWATYHYGRWDSSPQYGWYWVPQTQWAPAWVSWRDGGGYVGWAPLSPAGGGVVEVNTRGYVFVEEGRFLDPVQSKTVIRNNTAILGKTARITQTHIVNKAVFNEGPATAAIEKASGRKVAAVQVRDLRSKEEAPVIAKRATPAPTVGKSVLPPAQSQAEKVVPVIEPHSIAKPAIPAVESRPVDEPKRVSPEAGRDPENPKRQPVPAAAEAKPAAREEPKPVVAARPESPRDQPDPKAGREEDKKE